MTLHRVFLYNPGRPGSIIREVEAEIEVLEKCTWATVRKSRHLLGSTAFYSLAAANRSKRGALEKVLRTPALARMSQTRYMPQQAKQQLDYFALTGEFPITRRLN